MTISTYLEPTRFAYDDTAQGVLGQHIKAYSEENLFPDLEGMDMAIIGVPESRCSSNNGKCEQAPDVIREHFYALYKGDFNPKIVDLGNIKIGQAVTDTYAALADIMCQLFELDILPIILGGSQDLTYGMYNAYAKRKQLVNLFALDNKFDIGDPERDMDSHSYLTFDNTNPS